MRSQKAFPRNERTYFVRLILARMSDPFHSASYFTDLSRISVVQMTLLYACVSVDVCVLALA